MVSVRSQTANMVGRGAADRRTGMASVGSNIQPHESAEGAGLTIQQIQAVWRVIAETGA